MTADTYVERVVWLVVAFDVDANGDVVVTHVETTNGNDEPPVSNDANVVQRRINVSRDANGVHAWDMGDDDSTV